MATTATTATTEAADTKQKRQRSPSYPSDGLETCYKWARKLYDAEKRSATRSLLAVKHMGYSSLSGGARTGLSAMKKFGLMVEEGEKVRVSEDAVRLFLDPDETSRLTLLRNLAQKPEIIREILAQHPEGLPSDESLRFRLVTDRGFGGEEAANTFIRALRETVRFARLEPGQYTPVVMDQAQDLTPPPPPPPPAGGVGARVNFGAVDPTPPSSTLHVWSLGGGVTVELRSSAPLSPKHFKRLSKYVELAAEAEEDDADQDG